MLIPWSVIFFRGVGSTTNQIFSLEVGKLLNPTKPTYRGWKDISPFGWMCRGFSPALGGFGGGLGWPVGWGEQPEPLWPLVWVRIGGDTDWMILDDWNTKKKFVPHLSWFVFQTSDVWDGNGKELRKWTCSKLKLCSDNSPSATINFHRDAYIEKRLLPQKKCVLYPKRLVWSEKKFKVSESTSIFIGKYLQIGYAWCLLFHPLFFLSDWAAEISVVHQLEWRIFPCFVVGFYIFQWLEGGFWTIQQVDTLLTPESMLNYCSVQSDLIPT